MSVHVEESSLDDWELPEMRERDRARSAAEKADCCGDRMRFVAEIPRVRHQAGGRFEFAPARFRLCRYHATLLRRSDPRARIFPIPDLK